MSQRSFTSPIRSINRFTDNQSVPGAPKRPVKPSPRDNRFLRSKRKLSYDDADSNQKSKIYISPIRDYTSPIRGKYRFTNSSICPLAPKKKK